MEDLRHDERLEASVHEDCVEADDGEWWNGYESLPGPPWSPKVTWENHAPKIDR